MEISREAFNFLS